MSRAKTIDEGVKFRKSKISYSLNKNTKSLK